MSQQLEKPLDGDQVIELWKLFGKPPVLSSESLDAYEKLSTEYIFQYKPTNAIQLRAIREIVDADWENSRGSRHRTVAIDRYFRKEAADVSYALQQMNEKSKKEVEHLNKYGHDDAKKHQLQTLIQETEAKIAKLKDNPGSELDHNRSLEKAAPFLDRLDDWQNNARARRASAFQLLEYSLARTEIGDQKIVDAQYQAVEKPQMQHTASPSIAPTEALNNGVTAQESSEQAELPKE